MIRNNLVVDSDLFFQSLFCRSEIGLFIYVFVLPVCLFTCFCTWNHMFRVAACAKDHSAFRLCWNAGMPDYSLWLSRAAFVISVFPVMGFFFLNLWLLLARLYESWSQFPLTSSLLKITSCPWLWYKVVVPSLYCHLWPLFAGSGCYFWGRLWTERAQISTAWLSRPPMETLEGWDTSLYATTVLQSLQTSDFFHTLSWKRDLNYGTSTSQENRIYINSTCWLQRDVFSTKASECPWSTMSSSQSEPNPSFNH